MKPNLFGIGSCAAFCVTLYAHAYETQTHEEVLTRQAANFSVLQTNSSVLRDIGLEKSITDETQTFPDSTNEFRTIRRLLEIGSRFEDSTSPTIRPLRHFYNPLNSQGLSTLILPIQTSSPDWALATPGTMPGQEFSYLNARQYLFDALTKPSETERRNAFGRSFQALGQVVHHLQDMGQPQHVRNDIHCVNLACVFIGGYAPSLYEGWTNQNRGSLPTDFSLIGYDIVSPAFTSTFNSPRRFWNTEPPGPNSPLTGKGIAEFTNRNFVSAGTNFFSDATGFHPNPNFALPAPGPIGERISIDKLMPGTSLTGEVWFVQSQVVDNFLGGPSVTNPRASSFSVFDEDLQRLAPGFGRSLSLNEFTFRAAHDFLLPRAVAYSAGLINYFFRGKIDFVVDPNPANPGGFLIKNLGPEPMNGKFALYYDDRNGDRQPVADAGGSALVWDTTVLLASASGMLNAGANLPVPGFTPPTTPAPKVLGEYMLVFSGDMGEEKPENGSVGAVVAKAITNPYSGVLYIAGEDGAGHLQFFKVDKQGVSTATGQHPFSLAYVDHSVRERAYDYKQAVMVTTPSGAVIHKTVSLELKTGSLGVLANVSFVPDPASDALRPKLGIVWTAQSPDPSIGTFEFTLEQQNSSGRAASLLYTQRFIDAQGRVAQLSGVLALPDPIGAGFTYNDFTSQVFSTASGKLFISGDGTTIYPRGGTSSRRGLRIMLGAIPVAAFFDLPQGTSSMVITPHTDTQTQTGVCTLDYVANNGGPNFSATATGSRLRTETWNADSQAADSQASSTQIILEEFLNGELLSYERRFQSRRLDHTVTERCVAAGVDWSAGGSSPRVKVNVQFSKHVELTNHVEGNDVLPNGAFQYVVENTAVARPATDSVMNCGIVSGPAPGVSGPFTLSGAPFLDIDYSYLGFGPCPAPAGTVFSVVDTATQKKRIYRALTERSTDAVYSDDKEPGVLKFRSETVPPLINFGGNFVADASPIGEVFFATPDFSVLHHEPKAGNMPVLRQEMIPAGIVKLLAAMWL